ncbi:MAG: DUF433 domain-containing protein [Polyangiaceae bacterium]
MGSGSGSVGDASKPPMSAHPYVEVRADMGGSPVVAGSRVPVRRLWAWHRRGITVETLVKRYPALGWARVLGALAFAYDNQQLIEIDLEKERALMEAKGAAKEEASDHVPGAMKQVRLPFEP